MQLLQSPDAHVRNSAAALIPNIRELANETDFRLSLNTVVQEIEKTVPIANQSCQMTTSSTKVRDGR